MNNQRKKNIIIALLPIVLVPFGLWFVEFYHDTLSRYVFPCPVYTFTHIYCPGCGGTHSIYALSSGHILLAVKYNLLYVLGFLWLVLFWLQNVLAAFGRKIKIIPASSGFYLCLAGILAVYFILRNFIPVLAPF